MAAKEIHVGDKGNIFQITFRDDTSTVDLSGLATSTSRTVTFRKPDGSITSGALYFPTTWSGTSGVLWFTVPTTTFFDAAGEWKMQGTITFTASSYHSDIYTFTVHENLA
jgi:hypothetical protein